MANEATDEDKVQEFRDSLGSVFVTVTDAGGVPMRVKRSVLAKVPGYEHLALTGLAVPPSPDPVNALPEAQRLAMNDAYVAAHGPANPVRGHVVPAAASHPALAREVIDATVVGDPLRTEITETPPIVSAATPTPVAPVEPTEPSPVSTLPETKDAKDDKKDK